MFFFPFIITKKTHYNSFSKVIVYFITYLIPEFFILFFMNYYNHTLNFNVIPIFLISIFSFVNCYEVGYIYNECETIKKEKEPSKRLKDSDLEYYEKHKIIIYLTRLIFSFVLNCFLLFFIDVKSILLFSLFEVITLIVFFIYNNIRGPYTQIVYFFLCCLKYSSILFVFSNSISIEAFLSAIFVLPLLRTIEYKAHYGLNSNVNVFFRKYVIKYDVSKIPLFRVIGTFSLFLLCLILKLFQLLNMFPAIITFYMFLYRISLFFAEKIGIKFKGYLQR